MDGDVAPGFLYLNLEDRWPEFRLDGLAVEDGRLVLAPLAAAPEALGPSVAGDAETAWPAGIVEDETGDIWLSEPAEHSILRVACDGRSTPLRCLRGPGTEVGRVRFPRGLAVRGGRLLVADAGNHRVLLVDIATEQVVAVWGQPDVYAEPATGAEPGRFDDPWSLVIDSAGFVYVLDHGNARVQKLVPDGAPVASFDPPLTEPVCFALGPIDGEERLIVVDRTGPDAADRPVVLDLDGTEVGDVRDTLAEAWPRRSAAVAFTTDVLYVADDDAGAILALRFDGTRIGAVVGYSGTVAALGLDRAGDLLVHPGAGAPIVRVTQRAGRVRSGSFVGGPFETGEHVTQWSRVRASFEDLDPATMHVRLLTYVTDEEGDPPPPPGDGWESAPAGAADFLVLDEPRRFFWVAGVLEGDGAGTPALRQIRVEHDPDSWLRFLPAIYRRDDASRAFLERVLALLRSFLDDEEALIDTLGTLFDAWGAPDHAPDEPWLDWLAGWVALELEERWSEEKRRRGVAEAFARHGVRGTREGIRAVAELQVDAPVYVSEPAASAGLWALDGGGSGLGFTTTLASSEAEGAVVGLTAIVDRSNLLRTQDYGISLFEDVAHRFCVHVYASDLADPGAPERLTRVLEREKPAHTVCHVCVIGPRLRVGFQARVGVDSIVAGSPEDFELGGTGLLGTDSQLAIGARGQGAAIDGHTIVGRTARLGPLLATS